MDNTLKICRLCLGVISDHNFEAFDAVKLNMLKILLLNLSSAYTKDALICSQCCDKLQRIFCFKITCLDNNDYLKTFLHYGNNFSWVLEEIIVNESSTLDGIKHEEEKVCRFCLKYFGIESFTKLNELEEDIFLKNMLEKCLPEIDVNIITNPLMCQACMDMLQMQFNFVSHCLDVDEKIENFRSSIRPNQNTDLSDILKLNDIKLERENGDNFEYIPEVVVKKEENIEECEFHDKIKESPELNMKCEETIPEENLKPDSDSEKTMSDGACKSEQPSFPERETLKRNAYGMFVCTFCPHQTNRRDSLVTHFLTHKSATKTPELSQFRCEECGFVTKWQSSLKTHELLHKNRTELKLFYCAKCPYKTMHKKHVRRHCKLHMKSRLSPTDMHRCQYCSFATQDKSYFKQHNKAKHEKNVVLEEETRCEMCDYRSKCERNLNIHMRVAHDILKEPMKPAKRYACESCDYKTDKISAIQDHSLKHKSCEDVEMFGCSQCSFQTKYQSSLRSHLRRHTSGWKPQYRRRTDKHGNSRRISS